MGHKKDKEKKIDEKETKKKHKKAQKQKSDKKKNQKKKNGAKNKDKKTKQPAAQTQAQINATKFLQQQLTLDDAKRLLALYHKCCMIRPTGFGKTWSLTELIKSYTKVLYLYPSTVIAQTVVNRHYDSMKDNATGDYLDEDGTVIDPETVDTMKELREIKGVTMMTYNKLVRLTEDEMDAMDFDLIITDECHRLGGPKTRIAMMELLYRNPNADFIGATATPVRSDGVDVVSIFFSDHITYSYTIMDAINDGILRAPKYIYCTDDFQTELRKEALLAGQDLKNPTVTTVLDRMLIEYSTLTEMPYIIKENCDKYALDTNYMKFIVFFAGFNHINTKLNDVVGWFKEAYPDHNVNPLIITSRNKKESQNTDQLVNLTPRDNTIDLIACVDMLNMGYHVDNLTGVVMYRVTHSSTVFIQQFGRALSAGSMNSSLVFDVVDNLHREAEYRLEPPTPKPTSPSKKNPVQFAISSTDSTRIVTIDGDGNEHATVYWIDGNDNIVDAHGNPSTLIYDPQTGIIEDTCHNIGADVNSFTSNTIQMTGHEATLREIMAKVVAETVCQNCKTAFQWHFMSWCVTRGIPYPISDEDMKKLCNLSTEDFRRYFQKLVENSNLQYPIHDLDALLAIGSDGEDTEDVSLQQCADMSHVTVRQILDLMGL